MSNAAERLAALDSLPAADLCALATDTLESLVVAINQETTLLRAGRAREAGELTAEKTRLAQDYMGFARSVQRQAARLRAEAPAQVDNLLARHDKLATQMAENLRVIATARTVTEDLLTDVARSISAKANPKTYGATGQLSGHPPQVASGVSLNRAL
ncbi:flagellar protein FlgN [Devosia sp. ZB163]|uniref:flagellar protein FlgN n=1 Tax=Devosia sp. ZB163 TaxID=3025938 RepID=UPI00235FA54B|nr:flagellar protein FlgN [Devosia sp. ZB163]MDC9824355.1 flagellar protein FlgN [Devosia sp. ZB163]